MARRDSAAGRESDSRYDRFQITTMLPNHSAKVQNGFGMDWNDLRYFLAVAETGSTLAAGRALRVSQTTVARRLAALEAALGLILFDRRPSGYVLTPAGELLLARAGEVETAVRHFTDDAAAQQRDVSGTVRLTTSDIFAVTVLPPILRDLHHAYPAIRIELDTSDELRELGSAADVALRSWKEPTGGGIVGRRVADGAWAIYCSRGYAAERGVPTRRADLHTHPLIGGGNEGVWRYYHQWLESNGLIGSVVMNQNSSTGLLASVRAGVGLAVLPCFIADNDPDLLRCLPPSRHIVPGLWLLTHERLRHTPRIRAVLDFVGARLVELAQATSAKTAERG